VLVENWVKFSRQILNSLLEIIDKGDLNLTEFIQFRPEKELIYNSHNFVEDQNNFPFSALNYESSITKELYSIDLDLFTTPPTNFEVIEAINQYKETEELIKNYRFEEAAKLLNDLLIVFNKNQQRKVVISILLKLAKIAKILNHQDTALNYLQNALGVAKSGEIPVDLIIKIHYKLGVIYYKRKHFEKASNHFNIIINFLEREEIATNKETLLGLANLYIGLIFLENNNIEESKPYFKNAYLIGNDQSKVRSKYFLLRSKFYKMHGNLSLAQKYLKGGLDNIELDFNNEEIIKPLTDLILELSEFYINMKRAVRWNLLMSDYYLTFELNREKSQFYLKQGQKLKNQLQTIVVEG
jgi:tetratricopeptide (TPR) repeat protein